jgi:hypothetical protein
VPGTAGIDEVYSDLGVLDPSGGAGVLVLRPHRLDALLQIAGLVNHQHRPWVAQVLDDVGAHRITDRVVIPHCPPSRYCIPSGLAPPAYSAIV